MNQNTNKKKQKKTKKKTILFDILYHSLIGYNFKIVQSENKNQIGINGILIFESANLFHIKTTNGVKKILKSSVIVEIEYMNKKLQVTGKLLSGNLYSRIKKMK